MNRHTFSPPLQFSGPQSASCDCPGIVRPLRGGSDAPKRLTCLVGAELYQERCICVQSDPTTGHRWWRSCIGWEERQLSRPGVFWAGNLQGNPVIDHAHDVFHLFVGEGFALLNPMPLG